MVEFSNLTVTGKGIRLIQTKEHFQSFRFYPNLQPYTPCPRNLNPCKILSLKKKTFLCLHHNCDTTDCSKTYSPAWLKTGSTQDSGGRETGVGVPTGSSHCGSAQRAEGWWRVEGEMMATFLGSVGLIGESYTASYVDLLWSHPFFTKSAYFFSLSSPFGES